MNRSRVRNKYLKNSSEENKLAYNKQRNICTSLLRKEKSHFENLDTSHITDNKMFWKTIKPMFSKKCTMKEKITLAKNDEIVSDCQPVAELFNKFFTNIVIELNLVIDNEFLVNVDHIEILFKKLLKNIRIIEVQKQYLKNAIKILSASDMYHLMKLKKK